MKRRNQIFPSTDIGKATAVAKQVSTAGEKTTPQKRSILEKINIDTLHDPDKIFNCPKSVVSASFTKHEFWDEVINDKHNEFIIRIKKRQTGAMCDINLESCSSEDAQSNSHVYWQCTISNIFNGKKSGFCRMNNWESTGQYCKIEKLPEEWTVKFIIWRIKSWSDLIPARKSVALFPDFKQDPADCILAAEWELNDTDNFKNCKPGDCISSRPFGDAKAEVVMYLELYPNGTSQSFSDKLEVHLIMQHFPKLARESRMRMKCEIEINKHVSNVSEELYFNEGEKAKLIDCPKDPSAENSRLEITLYVLGIGIELCKIENYTNLEKMRPIMNTVYCDEKIIVNISEKEKDFSEKHVLLIMEMLKNEQKFNAAMRTLLLAFAEPLKWKMDENIARHIMGVDTFQALVSTDYIFKLYSTSSGGKSAITDNEGKIKEMCEMIKFDDVAKLENSYKTESKLAWNMDEASYNDVRKTYINYHTAEIYEFNKINESSPEKYLPGIWYSFPLLCVEFGRFKLIKKYFQLFISQNSIVHAAFIIDQLGMMKSKATLDETQKGELSKTICFLDEFITSLIVEVIKDNKERNNSVIEKYLDSTYKVLQNRSVMDILIENECVSFMQSDHSVKAVNETWKGKFYKQGSEKVNTDSTQKAKKAAKVFGSWLLYVPLLLASILATLFSLVPALCEHLHRYRTKDASSLYEEELKCLKISKYLQTRHTKTYEGKNENMFSPFVRFIMDSIMQIVNILILSYFVIADVHFFYIRDRNIHLYIFNQSAIRRIAPSV